MFVDGGPGEEGGGPARLPAPGTEQGRGDQAGGGVLHHCNITLSKLSPKVWQNVKS
jgi:hypothetical protein